jgi:hypothetical protein
MKKLTLLFFVAVIIFAGCSKNKNNKPDDGNKPPVETPADTLLTLNLANEDFHFYSSTYFVLTDESGEILNEVKYVSGTKLLKITSLKPYKKERFNFYEIDVSADATVTPSVIKGFLQVKKGSHYLDFSKRLLQKPVHELKYHLKNPVYFDQLDIRGDQYGYSLGKLADTVFSLYPGLTDDGKLYVHLLVNENHHLYNFFDVTKGATDFNIDMTKINKTPLVKSITSPGSNLIVEVNARADKNYYSSYYLGLLSSKGNQVNYYYPQEPFAEYITKIRYSLDEYNYYFTKNTTVIPDKADTYNAVINTPDGTLTTFKPSFSGPVDYYTAYFASFDTPGFSVQLSGPAAGSAVNIKFPDFSKYPEIKNVDLTKQILQNVSVFKDSAFDETYFPYKTDGNPVYPNLDLRSVSRNY